MNVKMKDEEKDVWEERQGKGEVRGDEVGGCGVA